MYRKKPKKADRFTFPDTLEGLGYMINDEGQLRSIEDGSPFKFEVKEKDRAYNEAHYEALLEITGDIIEQKLQNNGLVRKLIPLDVKPEDGDIYTKIYMSPNALETTDKLVLLIPPSNIRVGQWSRRVIIDDNIYVGSMLDTMARVRKEGYEVFIFNPNENFWWKGKGWSNLLPSMKRPEEIPGNATPEAHCRTVFDQLIKNCKASKIAAIASSWGTHCLMQLMNENFDFFSQRVQAVALVNSVHSKDSITGSKKHIWLFENVANWVASDEEFGTFIDDPRFGCRSISAAVELPDHIIASALDKILDFFRVKFSDEELEGSNDEEEDDYREPMTREEVAELAAHVDLSNAFGLATEINEELDWS